MIDALTSLCDQAVLDIPVEALRIIDESIVPLAKTIIGLSADTFRAVGVIALDVAGTTLYVVAP